MDWLDKHHGKGLVADKYRELLKDFSEVEVALFDALHGVVNNCPQCKGTRKANDFFAYVSDLQSSKDVVPDDYRDDCFWCKAGHEALDIALPSRKHSRVCECDECK